MGGRPRRRPREAGDRRVAPAAGHPLALPAMVLLVVLAWALSSCGPGTGHRASPSAPITSALPSAEAADATGAGGDPACAPGPDRKVEPLPDVTVPPVQVPPVVDPESGRVLAPGATVPGQVVDAGCIVRHTAPGGCAGAVDISAVTIPALVIPGQRTADRGYPAVTIPGVARPGVHADEQCRVTEHGPVPSVTRAGVVRAGVVRSGGTRAGDDMVATVRVPEVRLPDVAVAPARLTRHDLPRTALVAVQDSGRVSFIVPAAVLFDEDGTDLRPAAGDVLRTIVREIRRTAPHGRLLVEGHTDDGGSAAHGMALSRQRADAVADWLATSAGFARARLATEGWGGSKPAYPDDSAAHRDRNRRLVVTVVQP